MYNVLVCDDEKDIVSALQIYLKSEGYQVFSAYNGKEALKIINREDIQLVLMDIMMPEMDGLTVGADDYVTKPFNPVELQARVKSQIRRYMLLGSGQKVRTKLSAGGIELDDKLKEVTLDGEPVNLTRTEYDILKLLMEHPGEVYSPKQIYEAVWKGSPCGVENTVAVHIRHLREKLEYNPAEPRYLKVVWGRGYKMEDVENE